MKRFLFSSAVGLAAACLSAGAFAHTDVGVPWRAGAGDRGAAACLTTRRRPSYEPAPAYYGPYYGEYRYRRYRHDNGWHRGWRHHHHDDDD